LRRLKAIALDLAVIAGWAAFAAVVGVVTRASGLDFTSPRVADAFAFATLVAPATLTFAWQESSTRQATFGKRRTGLRVVDRPSRHQGDPGGRAGRCRIMVIRGSGRRALPDSFAAGRGRRAHAGAAPCRGDVVGLSSREMTWRP
jgi:uncharacterized RDD family membrane protein YckC